jgi:type I site-specific restriction endonuclease
MDKEPQEAFDVIRKQLQLILLRAELSQNSSHCEECATSVCEIVKEIRTLEAFIRDAQSKAS